MSSDIVHFTFLHFISLFFTSLYDAQLQVRFTVDSFSKLDYFPTLDPFSKLDSSQTVDSFPTFHPLQTFVCELKKMSGNKVAPTIKITDELSNGSSVANGHSKVGEGEEVNGHSKVREGEVNGHSKVGEGEETKAVDKNVFLYWEGLSYTVTNSVAKKVLSRVQGHKKVDSKKVIFSGLNGMIWTQSLVAIMGPSGAGKSTFLDCLANRKIRGRSGRVFMVSHMKKVKVSYIPQHDNYYDVLTVKESIMFASKLQNSTRKKHGQDYLESVVTSNSHHMRRMTISHKDFHEMVADGIIKMLGLAGCADVPAGMISGGQKKRLSIAQELVSKPSILFLDEPTSGLDSSACWSLMKVLHDLVSQQPPICIACTIHQPSPKMFFMFHKIITLSSFGNILFNDFPEELSRKLSNVGLVIPPFYNPGDFLIEVAAGEHGLQVVNEMIENDAKAARTAAAASPNSAVVRMRSRPLADSKPPKFPKMKHFRFLLHRSFILMIRDPMLTSLRFLMHFSVAIFVGYLYGSRVGKVTGCPPDLGSDTHFDPTRITSIQNDLSDEIKDVMDNLSNLFFNVLIIFFGSLMPTLLTFPLEMSIFVKETTNSWHGAGMYYLAKSLADLPFQILFPTIYVCITYFLNGQPIDPIRFGLYLLIMIMAGFLGQSFGLIFGAIFMNQPVSAVFIAPLAVLPTFLFSGFLVKIENMPEILQHLSWLSCIRFAMEGVIIAIYGFGRCSSDPKQMAITKHLLTSWITSVFSTAIEGSEDETDFLSGSNDTVFASGSNDGTLNVDNDTVMGMDDIRTLSKSVVDSLLSGVGGQTTVDTKGHSISGVMSIFNISDDHIFVCFLMLIANFVVLRITTYILIVWRSKAEG